MARLQVGVIEALIAWTPDRFARRTAPVIRNNDFAKAIAATRGVVRIQFDIGFVDPQADDPQARFKKRNAAAKESGRPLWERREPRCSGPQRADTSTLLMTNTAVAESGLRFVEVCRGSPLDSRQFVG